MTEVVSHMGRTAHSLQTGTMTLDLPTVNKRATVPVTGILLTILINSLPGAGKVDTVKLRPPMVSSMANTTTAKVPHALSRKNKIISQRGSTEMASTRVEEMSNIGMEDRIRCDIICYHISSNSHCRVWKNCTKSTILSWKELVRNDQQMVVT